MGSAAIIDIPDESGCSGRSQHDDVDATHDDDGVITEDMATTNSDGKEVADTTDNEPNVQVLQCCARQLCNTLTSLTYSLDDMQLLRQGLQHCVISVIVGEVTRQHTAGCTPAPEGGDLVSDNGCTFSYPHSFPFICVTVLMNTAMYASWKWNNCLAVCSYMLSMFGNQTIH